MSSAAAPQRAAAAPQRVSPDKNRGRTAHLRSLHPRAQRVRPLVLGGRMRRRASTPRARRARRHRGGPLARPRTAHAPPRHRKEFRQTKSGAGQRICAAFTPRAQRARRHGGGPLARPRTAHAPPRHRKEFRQAKSRGQAAHLRSLHPARTTRQTPRGRAFGPPPHSARAAAAPQRVSPGKKPRPCICAAFTSRVRRARRHGGGPKARPRTAHAPPRHRKEFRQTKSGARQRICTAPAPRARRVRRHGAGLRPAPAQRTRRRGTAKSFARQKSRGRASA